MQSQRCQNVHFRVTQLGHRFESLKEQYESKGIRIDRIDPERFGAMDAKAVLEQAFPDLSGQIGDK